MYLVDRMKFLLLLLLLLIIALGVFIKEEFKNSTDTKAVKAEKAVKAVNDVKDKTDKTDKTSAIVSQKYKDFIKFYNLFLVNWEKAIVTSIGLDQKPQELKKPTQKPTQTKPPSPTQTEMNIYIEQLSSKLNLPFPEITDALPRKMDPSFVKTMPTDPTLYLNALLWMNKSLETSHKELEASMKGTKTDGFTSDRFSIEGFDNANTCQQIVQCQQQSAEQQALALKKQNEVIIANLNKFLNNEKLQNELKYNIELIAKSQDIQNKAQSGELLSEFKFPEGEPIIYTLPDGHDSLTDMEKNDPAKYNDYKTNHSQWFSIKQMFDQINRSIKK